eukprot:14460016-Alexandrium_andersonii.AAC.1
MSADHLHSEPPGSFSKARLVSYSSGMGNGASTFTPPAERHGEPGEPPCQWDDDTSYTVISASIGPSTSQFDSHQSSQEREP